MYPKNIEPFPFKVSKFIEDYKDVPRVGFVMGIKATNYEGETKFYVFESDSVRSIGMGLTEYPVNLDIEMLQLNQHKVTNNAEYLDTVLSLFNRQTNLDYNESVIPEIKKLKESLLKEISELQSRIDQQKKEFELRKAELYQASSKFNNIKDQLNALNRTLGL